MYGGLSRISTRIHRSALLGHYPTGRHHPVSHPVKTAKLETRSLVRDGGVSVEKRARVCMHLQITVGYEVMRATVAERCQRMLRFAPKPTNTAMTQTSSGRLVANNEA